MSKQAHTIEDCLELLVGFKGQGQFQIESSDYSILHSIAKQIGNDTALTDRQYQLVKEKLLNYKDQFTSLEYDINTALETLRLPLRYIDRSKTVTIVDHSSIDEIYESYKEKWSWIKVRFPFNKKTIVVIEDIVTRISRGKYQHRKGSHEHFFALNEYNVYEIVSKLKDKNFEIETQLLDIYEKLEYMKNNKENYIPGIYNFKLKNLNDRAISYMISSVGEPSIDNLALYKDRQDIFGLHHFDQTELNESLNLLTTLSKKIVGRKNSNVFVAQDKYSINSIAESLLELNRFPLLVILPEIDPLSHLHLINTAFKGFIPKELTTILFRLDNKNNSEFNDYIRTHELNSPLDKETKVVYISNDNIPKPLLMSGWTPSAVLMIGSNRPHTRVGVYCESIDLVIHYDKEPSVMLRRNLDIL